MSPDLVWMIGGYVALIAVASFVYAHTRWKISRAREHWRKYSRHLVDCACERDATIGRGWHPASCDCGYNAAWTEIDLL